MSETFIITTLSSEKHAHISLPKRPSHHILKEFLKTPKPDGYAQFSSQRAERESISNPFMQKPNDADEKWIKTFGAKRL